MPWICHIIHEHNNISLIKPKISQINIVWHNIHMRILFKIQDYRVVTHVPKTENVPALQKTNNIREAKANIIRRISTLTYISLKPERIAYSVN